MPEPGLCLPRDKHGLLASCFFPLLHPLDKKSKVIAVRRAEARQVVVSLGSVFLESPGGSVCARGLQNNSRGWP